MAARVCLRRRNGPTRVLTTNDLGPRGVFLRSGQPIALDEPVEMEILLPGESLPVEVEGRVVWSDSGGGDRSHAGMGIQFTRVRNGASDQLKRFFAAHQSLAGSHALVVTDDPFEARDLVRAIAREGLQPQVVRWSDPRPAGDVPISAYIVVPTTPGQAAEFAEMRHSRDLIRPGLLCIITRDELTNEWLPVASMCLHGMPEPDRAAALTLCIAAPPGAVR